MMYVHKSASKSAKSSSYLYSTSKRLEGSCFAALLGSAQYTAWSTRDLMKRSGQATCLEKPISLWKEDKKRGTGANSNASFWSTPSVDISLSSRYHADIELLPTRSHHCDALSALNIWRLSSPSCIVIFAFAFRDTLYNGFDHCVLLCHDISESETWWLVARHIQDCHLLFQFMSYEVDNLTYVEFHLMRSMVAWKLGLSICMLKPLPNLHVGQRLISTWVTAMGKLQSRSLQ